MNKNRTVCLGPNNGPKNDVRTSHMSIFKDFNVVYFECFVFHSSFFTFNPLVPRAQKVKIRKLTLTDFYCLNPLVPERQDKLFSLPIQLSIYS